MDTECGDCWGKEDIRGQMVMEKNTIKIKFFKSVINSIILN